MVHPSGGQVTKLSCGEGVKAKVPDFGTELEDLTFSIAVQNQYVTRIFHNLCHGLI